MTKTKIKRCPDCAKLDSPHAGNRCRCNHEPREDDAMTAEEIRTQQPQWGKVLSALADASGICWDECHKIYILMDDEQVAKSNSWGYEVIAVAQVGQDRAYQILRQWYEDSCPLRFVQAVKSVDGGDPNDGYASLVPQGAGEEESDA